MECTFGTKRIGLTCSNPFSGDNSGPTTQPEDVGPDNSRVCVGPDNSRVSKRGWMVLVYRSEFLGAICMTGVKSRREISTDVPGKSLIWVESQIGMKYV